MCCCFYGELSLSFLPVLQTAHMRLDLPPDTLINRPFNVHETEVGLLLVPVGGPSAVHRKDCGSREKRYRRLPSPPPRTMENVGFYAVDVYVQ